MPSALAWNMTEGAVSGSYEVLFPGEAMPFQVYDEKEDVYRILLVHCDEDDEDTCVYEFERTDEINLGMDMQELAAMCSEEEPWEEIAHGKSFVADTFADPDTAVALFIGHQVTMTRS